MNHRRKRLALALGAGAVTTALAGLALAQAATEGTADQTASAPASEQAALDRFCSEQGPCVIVNGNADPNAGDSVSSLVTPGEALAASGRPPSACPKADDAYEAIGVDADAFVGPCPKGPPPSGPGAARRFHRGLAEAMAVQGGSR